MASIIIISWLAAALVAGGLAVISVGVVRAGKTFDGPTWTIVHRAMDRAVGRYFAILLLVAIGTTAGVAASLAAVRTTYAIAAALFTATLVISLVINVPINREVAGWSTPPDDWSARRDRWNAAQVARSLTAFAGLACLTFH